MRDNAIHHVLESEAFNLVQYFDSDNNGSLSFQEFIQMLLPCEDNVLRNITLDRPSIRVGRFDFLPRDIELSIATVIEKEILLQRKIELLKRDLHNGLDYSAISSFRSVDKYNSGLITTVNLGAFLREQGHFAPEIELLAIIRRIDTDGDAALTLAEFSEFLRPLAAVSLPVPVPVSSLVVDPLPYVPAWRRYALDYPLSRPLLDVPVVSRYDPYYNRPLYDYPVTKTETIELERPTYYSPSRAVKRTTYHSPLGDRTYTQIL